MRFRRATLACFILGLIGATIGISNLAADQAGNVAAYEFVERIQYEPPNQNQVKTELSGMEANPIPNSGGKAALKGVTIKQFPVTGGAPQMVAETPECIYDPKRKEVSSPGPLKVHAQGGKFFVEGVGFLLQQTNNSLAIYHDVHSILQLQQGTNATAATNTEIFSHSCDFQMKEGTNGLATYLGDVRVVDPRMKLWSESLVAELPRQGTGQTNHVQHIIAETNVVLDFISENGEHTHATGQKAVYDHKTVGQATNEVMELTGDPRVDLTNGWMTADVFLMNRTTGKLSGQDRFHFHYFGQAQPTVPAKTNAPTEAEIFSDYFDFDLNTRLANFWGRVRADNGQMKLVSGSLTTTLPKQEPGKTNRLDHVLAETNVVIDFVDEKNAQHVHTAGQHATYDYHEASSQTNAVLELKGNPSVETTPLARTPGADTKPSGWMTADVITLDRAQGHIWGVGNHHSVLKKQATETATMDTEIFSDRFDFSMVTRLSVYQDHVRAYDPEMNLASQKLTVKLTKGDDSKTNRIEYIFAEGNVAIDFVDKPFTGGDITNLTALARRLKQPDNDATRYVSSQISTLTKPLLAAYQGGTNHEGTNEPLRSALVMDLNRLAQSGTVYETNRFTGIYLSLDTTDLLKRHPLGIDLVELNRLLLLDAFRGQIKRGQQGEKTHATGDQATYNYLVTGGATNQVLKLTGHPRLEKASGWVTADDSIIDNRTTGIVRFIGKPVFHTKLEGMVNHPPTSTKKKQ